MNAREGVLSVLLLVTLIVGICMALCISLILNPIMRDASDKAVSARGLNLMALNRKCNCGIVGLDYKFKHLRGRPSKTKKSNESRSNDTNEAVQVRSLIGPDTVYDEEEHLRSLGFSEDEISQRIEKVNPDIIDALTETTSAAIHPIAVPTTPAMPVKDGGLVIDDDLINSIWKAISTKKLNSTNAASAVNKRSFPKEAPHCFVPTLKKGNPADQIADNYKRWKFHPYLISISNPKYLDDPGDIRFLCSGVVIDKQYALTGKTCIMGKFREFVTIRSSSAYWSKEGLLHHVVEIFYSTTLALLKIQPQFKIDAVLKRNPTTNAMAFAKDLSTSAGWILEDRRRFSKYSVVKWKENCKDCQAATFNDGLDCNVFMGDPLINNGGILIGIRSCGNSFVGIDEIESLVHKLKIM